MDRIKREEYLDIITNKKKFNSLKIKKELERFNDQEKEIILFKNLDKEALLFPFESNEKLLESYSEKNAIEFISTILWDNENKKTVLMKGDNTKSKFIISRNLKDKYADMISDNRGFGKIKVRKNKENEFFIEKLEPLRESKETNYKRVCELRRLFVLEKWKDVLLGSIGYDLSSSKYLTKDLLLVRLIPYVEKNYNYIELGGMATGKTTMTEMFNTAEKISSNISGPSLLYNSKTKEHGMLFTKDVLYLDETNFSKIDKELAPSLLQAKSGNKIEVRGKYDSKKSFASFVSQGNVMNPVNKFKEKRLLEDFKKGFNISAHFDRECFFLAGWLIPSYKAMAYRDDTLGLRLDVLEDYLSILREKESYHKIISNLKIELVGSQSTTRFREQILKTVSGFMKLLNPEKDINLKELDLKKIVALSVYGKYLLQESACDLGESNFDNDYVTYYFEGINKNKVTRQSLKKYYIENKESKYFFDESIEIEETEDSPYEISEETEAVNSNIERKIDKIEISESLLKLLDELKIPSKTSKVLTHYKYAFAYQYSNKTEEDTNLYLEHLGELISFYIYATYFFYYFDISKIFLIEDLIDEVNNLSDSEINRKENNELVDLFNYLLSKLPCLKERISEIIDITNKKRIIYDNEINLFIDGIEKNNLMYEELKNKYKFRMELKGWKRRKTKNKDYCYEISNLEIDVLNLPINTTGICLEIEKFSRKRSSDSLYFYYDNNLKNLKLEDKNQINSTLTNEIDIEIFKNCIGSTYFKVTLYALDTGLNKNISELELQESLEKNSVGILIKKFDINKLEKERIKEDKEEQENQLERIVKFDKIDE